MLTKQELDTQSYHRVSDPVKNWSEKYYQEIQREPHTVQNWAGRGRKQKMMCERCAKTPKQLPRHYLGDWNCSLNKDNHQKHRNGLQCCRHQEKLHSSAEVKFLLKLHFCLKYAKENLKKDFESQSLSSGKTL